MVNDATKSYIVIDDYKVASTKKLSPNFMAKDFRCGHCGTLVLNEDLLNRLEKLVSNIGPIKIIQGYRCPDFNKVIGSYEDSPHVKGEAADFIINSKLNGFETFLKTKDIFNHIGFNQFRSNRKSSYIHVDVGEKPLYWLSYYDDYLKKRVYIYFNTLDHMIAAMKKDKQHDWFSVVI